MAWDRLADLANLATRRTVGEPLTYTPFATGTPVAIVAPFDEAFAIVDLQGDVPVQSTAPAIDVRLADLALAPACEDRVRRASTGKLYEVITVQPGGAGTARLVLVVIE